MYYLNQKIRNTDLPVRGKNKLMEIDCRTLGDLINISPDSIKEIYGLGTTTIQAILSLREDILVQGYEEYNPEILEDGVIALNLPLDDCNLSNRAKNRLRELDCKTLGDVLSLSEENLLQFRNVGESTLIEISKYRKDYMWVKIENEGEASLSVFDLVNMPAYGQKAKEFVKLKDKPIGVLGISPSIIRVLLEKGYSKLSDIFLLTDEDLLRKFHFKTKAVNEIKKTIYTYISDNSIALKAFCLGNMEVEIDVSDLKRQIVSLFDNVGFEGLHFEDINDSIIPYGLYSDDVVKEAIGELLADGVLEYVDYRLYKNYPSFCDYIQDCKAINDEQRKIIIRRLENSTLQSLGDNRDVSRQDISEKQKMIIKKIRVQYYKDTGFPFFDEDYYKHLYTNYKFNRGLAVNWLGIPAKTFNYLKINYKNGTIDIQKAMDDANVHMVTKMGLYNYNHRKQLLLDGKWIDKDRGAIENYLLPILCKEKIALEEFYTKYNEYLADLGDEFAPFFITEDVKRSRENSFRFSRFVVHSSGKKIRFYDIDKYDFSELYEAIGFESYVDIDISTYKWFVELPDIMKKYDIQDQYELHSILRKTYNPKMHPGEKVTFLKSPNIGFGNHDKYRSIRELLFAVAPIRTNDFVDLIVEKFGYDRPTIYATYLKHIAEFFDNSEGKYVVSYPAMSESRMSEFQCKLTKDCYFFEELKTIYSEMYPDANVEEINAYNLKKMGFLVSSDFAIRHFETLDEFFGDLLLNSKRISSIRSRFGHNPTFYEVLRKKRESYEILMINDDEVVSLHQLTSRVNMTLEDIKCFCDSVFDYVHEDEYFTISSLKRAGFESNLFDYGFEDWFYASILSEDKRFSTCRKMGTLVIHSGPDSITFVDFIESMMKNESSIDLIDLMSDLRNIYGIKVIDKYDVLPHTGSLLFYDNLLDRIYYRKELYYKEIEEGA